MVGEEINAEMGIRSKGLWAGIGLIAYAVIKYILYGDFDVRVFLEGLGIIGIRHSIAKL